MNPGGLFLVFLGALAVAQITGGHALTRLNLFSTSSGPGNALGPVAPNGAGSGGILLPPGTGLTPGAPPPPLVAPIPGRPIPGDIPGVTGAQPNGLGDYLGGLTK